MSAWWTYRPSDFLLFAARTYYRLFELYNADIWPLQLVTLLAGAAIVVLMISRRPWGGRVIAVILMACWLWVAWAFHWQRYSTINWAATYFAAGFAIEAALLLWIGVLRNRLAFDPDRNMRSRIGVVIVVFALVAQPLVGLLSSRGWAQVETFGVAPDPTAVATLGVLLAADRPHRTALLLPLLWCVTSSALWSAIQTADALVMGAAATLALLRLFYRS